MGNLVLTDDYNDNVQKQTFFFLFLIVCISTYECNLQYKVTI